MEEKKMNRSAAREQAFILIFEKSFNSDTTIDELVAFLNANPDTKIAIKAYADKATGNAGINKRLSVARAAVVEKALKKAGIAANRIAKEDFGDTVNPYPTPEENRVSVCVVDK